MTLNEYQRLAKETCVAPSVGNEALYYRALGLAGEAGEVANKVKKIIRDHGGVCSPELVADLRDEIGDVLWYAAMLADALGLSFSDVAQRNITKLTIRYGGARK